MARAPDKRIGQAKAMYLQGRKLVGIAEVPGVISTIGGKCGIAGRRIKIN